MINEENPKQMNKLGLNFIYFRFLLNSFIFARLVFFFYAKRLATTTTAAQWSFMRQRSVWKGMGGTVCLINIHSFHSLKSARLLIFANKRAHAQMNFFVVFERHSKNAAASKEPKYRNSEWAETEKRKQQRTQSGNACYLHWMIKAANGSICLFCSSFVCGIVHFVRVLCELH